MESLFVYGMIFGPALIGLGAVVGGVALLARRSQPGRNTTATTIVAALLLTLALGIGACYAVMFLPGFRL